MNMRSRFVSSAGFLLVILSFVFLGWRVRSQWANLRALQVDSALVLFFFLSVLTYFSALFFLVLAWQRLLRLSGTPQVKFKTCLAHYARAQIVKYFPGNVLHVASRHWLGVKSGIAHSSLLWSATFEIAGLIICAVLLGLIVAGCNWLTDCGAAGFGMINLTVLGAVILIFSLIVCLGTFYLRRDLSVQRISAVRLLLRVGEVVLLYLVFFLLSGLAFLLILMAFKTVFGFGGQLKLVSDYALAWLAGVLTPGAPAGLGVREAVLVAVSGKIIADNSVCLAAVILFRLVSILADILFFAVSFRIRDPGLQPGPRTERMN